MLLLDGTEGEFFSLLESHEDPGDCPFADNIDGTGAALTVNMLKIKNCACSKRPLQTKRIISLPDARAGSSGNGKFVSVMIALVLLLLFDNVSYSLKPNQANSLPPGSSLCCRGLG